MSGETSMISAAKSDRVYVRKTDGFLFLMVATVLFAMGFSSVARGEILCKAEVNRTSVPVGGDIILTVTAEGSIDWSTEFEPAPIPGVSIRRGGTNQSMSFVNGRSSTTISRTYYLHVDKKQNFTIKAIEVSFGGVTCQSNPIPITVTVASQTSGVPPSYSGNRVRRPSDPDVSPTTSANKEIFITLEVDSDEVWVGQQVILTFKYWHRGQSWASPSYQAPKAEGFWRENLGKERSYEQRHQGWNYKVTEMKYALFPTRSGALTIEPAELEFSGSGGFFFGSRRRNQVPKKYKTNPIVVQVNPLPLPRPTEFSGIAGTTLEIASKVNRSAVPAGESVTFTIEMLTDGFVKGFAGIEVEAPGNCRVHDGSENLETMVGSTRRRDGQRLIGRYSHEKILVPGVVGPLEIPRQAVSWFNVRTGEYEMAQTAVQRVTVEQGRPGAGGSETSGFRRSEIERLGQDLAFIHQAPNNLSIWKPLSLHTALYWICIALPLLGLACWRIYMNKLLTDRRNPANVRRRQALAVAIHHLKKIEEIDNNAERLGPVSRVVSCYVADILDRPQAAVGGQEIRQFCTMLNLDGHGVKLEAYLHASDTARYGGTDSMVASSVSEVKGWLTDLDQAFKKLSKSQAHSSGQSLLSMLVVMYLTLGVFTTAQAANNSPTRPGPDPVRLLAEGNQAYTAGNIDLATDLYNQALSLGANDAIVHFNLGNAYARQGKLGQAVVSYLRAQRLDPLNRDIKGNLRWVRSQLKDLELQQTSLPLFIAQAVTVIGWFTLAQWSFVPLLLFWALVGLVGWGWYRDEFTNNLRKILIVTVALFLVGSGVTGWRYYLEEMRNQAVIVVTEASVYSGPADSYPVLFEVHDGLTVNLNEFRDGWVRMDLGGQWQGWVPATSIEPVRRTRD